MDLVNSLFFHCNLLYTSGPNLSPDTRWVLICCYNAARNNPFRESSHPFNTLLEKVENYAIKEKGKTFFQGSNLVGILKAKKGCFSDIF